MLDAWLRILDAMIVLDSAADEEPYPTGTGGPYRLTGPGCPVQARHKDFEAP